MHNASPCRAVWLALAALTVVACADASPHGPLEVSEVVQAVLLAPSLQSSSGTLCFSDVRDFHVGVGMEEPQAGYVSIDAPHSEAVLAGTGLGAGSTAGSTSVTFIVTGLNAAWNNVNYGPARRVCAEVAVLNACNLMRACWLADGNWTIQRKSNPGAESLDECGENGVTTLAASTSTTRLPVLEATTLTAPSHTQQITLNLLTSPTLTLVALFRRDGVLVRSASAAVPTPTTFEGLGLANGRVDRVFARGGRSGIDKIAFV